MKAKATGPVFYVYEHWRPDRDICFWVGKGYGNRAYDFRRNFHYNNVVKKLSRLGMCVEVRLVQSGLEEKAALVLEVERIAFWRTAGISLTNYTNGGEGVAGLRHTEETRAKIRANRKPRLNYRHSDETKRKISAANAGKLKGRKNPAHSLKMRGRKQRPEQGRKISAALKGHHVSAETRAKLSASHMGQRRSAEARQNMRAAQLGKKQPPEQIKKRMAAIEKYWETADRELRGELTRAGFTPEVRANLNQKAKERFSTPEERARLSAQAKRRWDRVRMERADGPSN